MHGRIRGKNVEKFRREWWRDCKILYFDLKCWGCTESSWGHHGVRPNTHKVRFVFLWSHLALIFTHCFCRYRHRSFSPSLSTSHTHTHIHALQKNLRQRSKESLQLARRSLVLISTLENFSCRTEELGWSNWERCWECKCRSSSDDDCMHVTWEWVKNM